MVTKQKGKRNMNYVRVYLETDEWYPVFNPEECAEEVDSPYSILLTKQEFKEYKKIEKQFKGWQRLFNETVDKKVAALNKKAQEERLKREEAEKKLTEEDRVRMKVEEYTQKLLARKRKEKSAPKGA